MAIITREEPESALARIQSGQSENDTLVIHLLAARGIDPATIEPRVNVLTFNAWRAKGRHVRKGEKGTHIPIWKHGVKKDADGSERMYRFPGSAVVFHESQTDPDGAEPGPVREVTEAPPAFRFVDRKCGRSVANDLDERADRLQAAIDDGTRDRRRNTPKQQRQADCARFESYDTERTQRAMRALAALHRAGNVPPLLRGYRSTKGIADAVRKGVQPVSYYVVRPGDDYQDTSDSARTLQALIDHASAGDATRAQSAVAESEARGLVGVIEGFFPTPESIAERMIDLAGRDFSGRWLEPSAGDGALAKFMPRDTVLVERSHKLCDILRAKGFPAPICDDFTTVDLGPDGFRRIVMNPPFERGQDIGHVRRAFDLLEPGGRLISIMSPGPFFRSDRKSAEFREWFDRIGGTVEELPEGSFKASGTSVAARLIVLDK